MTGGTMTEGSILTPRFALRHLKSADVGPDYVDWFRDPEVSRFISAAASAPTLDDLKCYVAERQDRDDVDFLGIFDPHTGAHIGNIKYEPVSRKQGYAVIGVLIGDPVWRGKGVAREVIAASANWLWRQKNISRIYLGVSRLNIAAIRAYMRIGFREIEGDVVLKSSPENMAMVLNHQGTLSLVPCA